MGLFRQTAVIAVVTVAAGCLEVPEAPPQLDVRLSATTAWSGGTVQLVSPSFARLKSPAVTIGSSSAPVTVIDDSTISVSLPQTTGSFDVWVSAGGGRTEVGLLRLVGFRDTYPGPVFSGTPYWLVPGGPPLLIGEGDHGGAILDVAHNTALQITPDSIHSPDCAITVGPTYAQGTWVFTGSNTGGGCRYPRAWAIGPSYALTAADSLGAQRNSEAWWVMAQPGPQRWVFDWNNNMYLIDCSIPACSFNSRGDGNNVSRILVSPKSGRFLMLPSYPPRHTVVYDAARMDTAYTLPRTEGSGAFSFDGDTLFLLGYDSGGLAHIEARVASTGQLGYDLALSSLGVSTVGDLDVAVDPLRPWLYIALTASDQISYSGTSEETVVPVLVVVDRNTWRVVGVAPGGPMVLPVNGGYQGTLVPSPTEKAIYIVETTLGYNSHGIKAVVSRFDTP